MLHEVTMNAGTHLYGGEDGRHIVDGAPLVLQNVQADAAVRVDCSAKIITLDYKNVTSKEPTELMGRYRNRGQAGGQAAGLARLHESPSICAKICSQIACVRGAAAERDAACSHARSARCTLRAAHCALRVRSRLTVGVKWLD